MSDFTVKIEGLAEVKRKLKLLPERVGRNAMRRALRKGANVIRDAARGNATRVDDPKTREQITKNIVVQGGRRSREKQAGGPLMRVGVLGGSRNMAKHGEFTGSGKGNPGGDTWYWRLLEFGTSKMAARPFMRPAMQNNAERTLNVTAQAMQVETDKELEKL